MGVLAQETYGPRAEQRRRKRKRRKEEKARERWEEEK